MFQTRTQQVSNGKCSTSVRSYQSPNRPKSPGTGSQHACEIRRGVHRAIYVRRLVFKGKTGMHLYPTICDLVRICDTENQKRIRARNRADARLMARKCRRVRSLPPSPRLRRTSRLRPPPLPRHQPSVFRSRMRHRNSPCGRRTRNFGQRMYLKFCVVRPKGEFP